MEKFHSVEKSLLKIEKFYQKWKFSTFLLVFEIFLLQVKFVRNFLLLVEN